MNIKYQFSIELEVPKLHNNSSLANNFPRILRLKMEQQQNYMLQKSAILTGKILDLWY